MSTGQSKKRTKNISEISSELDPGTSHHDVELMFNWSQSTVSRVLTEKDCKKQKGKDCFPRKRNIPIWYKELEHALNQWARNMENTDVAITAGMAKQKAKEFSSAMGHELTPSRAWLYRWKERKNIKFGKDTKDSCEVLHEFSDKQKIDQKQRAYKEKTKRLKFYSEEIPPDAKKYKKQMEKQPKNERLASNNENKRLPSDNESKPRTVRRYVQRVPIVDASGVICRNRKEKTFLTLLQKLEILHRLKNGERKPDLVIEYNLSQSAMSQIVTDEEKILKLAAGGQNLQVKRIRSGTFKHGEAELNVWVQKKLENGESITRTQVQNQAKHIAQRLNLDFKASSGWLEKWKARMNLDFNEYHVLQRKVTEYIVTDTEIESSCVLSEQASSYYDHQESAIQENQEKEQAKHGVCDYIETKKELIYNDIEAIDVKPEIITPQQFYLQAMRVDSNVSLISNDTEIVNQRQNKVLQKQEEYDVKPFIDMLTYIHQNKQSCSPSESSQYIPNKQICIDTQIENEKELFKSEEHDVKTFVRTPLNILKRKESSWSKTEHLHSQVLYWLSRYNIAPAAASELLSILQLSSSSITENFSNSELQNRNMCK